MGRFKKPVEDLRKLVASSATFRDVVGLETELLAVAKVLPWTANDTLPEEQVPRATVGPAGNRKLVKKSTTGWRIHGGLVVVIEVSVPVEYRTSRGVAYDWFTDTVDAIIEEMAQTCGKNGYLIVEEFIEFEPPDFIDSDDNNGLWEMDTTYIVVT